jgi:hypothetical protein
MSLVPPMSNPTDIVIWYFSSFVGRFFASPGEKTTDRGYEVRRLQTLSVSFFAQRGEK